MQQHALSGLCLLISPKSRSRHWHVRAHTPYILSLSSPWEETLHFHGVQLTPSPIYGHFFPIQGWVMPSHPSQFPHKISRIQKENMNKNELNPKSHPLNFHNTTHEITYARMEITFYSNCNKNEKCMAMEDQPVKCVMAMNFEKSPIPYPCFLQKP